MSLLGILGGIPQIGEKIWTPMEPNITVKINNRLYVSIRRGQLCIFSILKGLICPVCSSASFCEVFGFHPKGLVI
jgi:hypothetical protein